VVLADEVTLTVEEIYDGDGRRIFGATVRLGFQSPRYVSIYRSELCTRGSGNSRTVGTMEPARPRTGKVVEISGAQVRLRIQVPRKIPVSSDGTQTVELDSKKGPDDPARTPEAVYHVTCHKEDRIKICNNITVATLEFHRFVSSGIA